MKLRKVLLLTAATAALGSMNVISAFADAVVVEEDGSIRNSAPAETTEGAADTESMLYGWTEQGSNWVYYDGKGNTVKGWIKAEGGDGRGNEVWFYTDPETGLMVANQTRVIDGVSYSFNEDGSWVAPVPTAPKGKLSGGVFTNTWSNIRIPQVIGSTNTEVEAEELFSDDIYGTIGNPKVTYDFSMSTDFGELEIYYANMAKMPEMDAATFAAQLGNAEKGKTGQVGAVETVTVGGQNYSRVSITRTNKKGKQNQTSFYCRKQGSFMVILATSCTMSDAGAMADVVNMITAAQ